MDGIGYSDKDLLTSLDQRNGPKETDLAIVEHREGLHSCRETDACYCLNCQIHFNGWRLSYAILSSNCPLCRLDLMNGKPAGHDYPAKF